MAEPTSEQSYFNEQGLSSLLSVADVLESVRDQPVLIMVYLELKLFNAFLNNVINSGVIRISHFVSFPLSYIA